MGFYFRILLFLSILAGDTFEIFFLLLELTLTDEFFLIFTTSFLPFYFSLYLSLLAPSFPNKLLTDCLIFLLFPFLRLSSSHSPILHCELLWLLRRVNVEDWWLCLFEILRSFIYSFYLIGYFGNFEREFINFWFVLFLRGLDYFFNIQNLLLSPIFLLYYNNLFNKSN